MKNIRKIKPIKIQGGSKLPVKGHELVSDLYARIFCCAPSNSGKSTVINHLVKNTIDERTTVVIFSSTVEIDPIYQNIVKFCNRKKIPIITFNHIIQDGVNMLEKF